ncbi:MAG TPA: hypothetical protein VIF09_25665, partial [Polyangiaceae bacterium]
TTSTYGQNGQTDNLAAAGGNSSTSGTPIGGSGSAGKNINGSPGVQPNLDAGAWFGGGGGAAGWIRLNSSTGQAQMGGNVQISPDLTTTCASQGTIH